MTVYSKKMARSRREEMQSRQFARYQGLHDCRTEVIQLLELRLQKYWSRGGGRMGGVRCRSVKELG